MRRILLIFKNDVKRRLKSPLTILVLMGIPLVMTGIIGAVFGPGSDQTQLPKIKVLVVDNDKNIGSKLFMGAFTSPQLKDMFEITLVDEAKGTKLISRGKASALIIIPEKFTDHLIKAEKSQFTVIKNPSEQFLPSVVEEFMNTYAVIISGLVQAFEPEIKAIEKLLDRKMEDVSVQAMVPFLEIGKKKIESLVKYLDPLLIQLKTEVTGKEEKETKPGINVFSFVLPGMAVMFLFFIIEIFLRDMLSEREDGKLKRMMFSPLRTMEVILARIFSGWIMGIGVLLLIVVAGVVLFKISWGNFGSLLLLAAVTCFWIAAFFALLDSFFKNRNQAGAFTAPIILVFSAFGGSILPVDQLPAGVGWVAKFTLNHWFIQGSSQIKDGVFPALSIGLILLTSIILFIAAAVSLKKRITV